MPPRTRSTPSPTASSTAVRDGGLGTDNLALNTRTLEQLIGYNTRRVDSAIGALFAERMAPYGLKQVEYSVLVLLAHNPGATSRQLCTALAILPPNLVNLIASLDRRGLIERRPHPRDRRAIGLHLTAAGQTLAQETEAVVSQLESDAAIALTEKERHTLRKLLQKMYKLDHPPASESP